MTTKTDPEERSPGRILALVVGLETVVRFVLATWDPLLFVLFPPIVAVVLLGAGFSESTASAGSGDRTRGLVDRLREVGPRLVGVAVVGHAVALAVGTGLFLLVDTTVRYAFYATGGSLGWRVVVVAPLVGVALGTFVTWGPLADTVDRVAGGESIRTAGIATLGRALRDGRWLGERLALHAAGGGLVVGALVVGFVVSGVALLVLPVLAVIGATAALYAAYANRPASNDTTRVSVPVGRLAAVVLVFVVLVSAASAVRVTETRPMPTGSTPLPEDPNAMYATALANTETGDHAITITQRNEPGGRWTIAVERSDREARITTHDPPVGLGRYQSAGTSFRGVTPSGAPSVALGRGPDGDRVAVPGYWMFRQWYEITGDIGGTVDVGIPRAGTGQWHVRERSNGTVVLELTSGRAVYRAVTGEVPRNATYETAWVRMRIDTTRGVLTGGELRLNATVRGDHVRIDRSYDVRTESRVDVRRPAELGGRTIGEWTWKLFAY